MAKVKPKAKGGRPRMPAYVERQRELLRRVSEGELVRDACAALGISLYTPYDWARENEEFSKAYARAREAQAHAIAEQALTIADGEALTSEAVARHRLMVDTRKWLASKIAPRSYGERQTLEHEGPGGGPLVVRVVRE